MILCFFCALNSFQKFHVRDKHICLTRLRGHKPEVKKCMSHIIIFALLVNAPSIPNDRVCYMLKRLLICCCHESLLWHHGNLKLCKMEHSAIAQFHRRICKLKIWISNYCTAHVFLHPLKSEKKAQLFYNWSNLSKNCFRGDQTSIPLPHQKKTIDSVVQLSIFLQQNTKILTLYLE